ncbi:MAG: hypothetical protein KJ726_02300 [Verrucomicrobia bacterium]|nr:hypothetical protein [Verrucomicrobiota bacterium]MBU1908859.1 hypothetical protein [Verrucomicrobiota bacterium]
MKKPSYEEVLNQVVREDPRYDAQAYEFLREALDFTIKLLNKPAEGPTRHVSGGELLEGIRQYALQEFGPMALTVLNRWGVRRCEDFGEMVFNLVDKGILGKTDRDRKEDFGGGYDFEQAFRQPFLAGGKADLRAPPRGES